MEYHDVSSRFSQPLPMHVHGGNYGFLLPIPTVIVDSIWVVPVIILDPFSYSHTHGGHAIIRQTSRVVAPFQPSGSLQGGVQEDDTWILNLHDHHPLQSPPEASPQTPRTNNGLTEHTVSKFLETRNSDASGGDEEICVVCQDDLINDRIATLDCRHRYHVECIKTWLTLKNFCPICKAVAIGTVDS